MDKNKLLNLIIIAGSLAILLILATAGYQAAVGAMKESDEAPNPLVTLAPLPQKELTPPATTNGTAVPEDSETAPEATPGDAPAQNTTQGAAPQAQLAPDFTVYDREGKAHKLSDFRGKPVVLNFWASWCGPCKSEMPDFDKAYQQYGQDIHFVMVNLTDGQQETVETAAALIEKEGYRFPVYFDTDMDAAATYGVSAVPVTYFIDRNGYLIAYGQGALSAQYLQKGIDMIYP